MEDHAMDLDHGDEHQDQLDVAHELQHQLAHSQPTFGQPPSQENGHAGFNANPLAPLPSRQPLALYSGQTVGLHTRQPLPRIGSPPNAANPHHVDDNGREGVTAKGAYLTPPDNTGVSREDNTQDIYPTQALSSIVEVAEEDTAPRENHSKQSIAPVAKRKVRKFRKKRPAAPVVAQPEVSNHEPPMEPDLRATQNDNHIRQDATTDWLAEPVVNNGSHSNLQQEQRRTMRRDSSHLQLQKEMRAAAVEEDTSYHAGQDLPTALGADERLEGYDPQMAPTMNPQYFQPQQDQFGPPGSGPDHIDDMPPDQCPSSDIFADAAQEFEHKIYRKQQAKSAKHRAERKAWQRNFQHEQQAKRTLQDKFDMLQQEKDHLAAAIEKQKARVSGFDAMASKLKTFIGGLANDMGALKRDASSHRQSCREIGEESKEQKAVLDFLLQQLSSNAEKSSHLKDEAIKACHGARSELSGATMRANHLEEQLKEKSLLLIEERSLRDQMQSQLDSAANFHDTTLRQLKSSEQSVLDKIDGVAASVAEAEGGDFMSEQLGKALTAAQELKSQQTTTMHEIVLVKGIVERLSASLDNHTGDTQRQADHESLLKTYIEEALGSLRSDLCQQQALVAQDATNREVILGLQKKLEDANDRVAKSESTLATIRASEDKLKADNNSLQARINALQTQITSTSEQDAANLNQLREELNLKVIALRDTRLELDVKVDELGSLSATNGELTLKLNAFELQVKESPTAATFEAERKKLEEKYREEMETAKQEATTLFNEFHDTEMSRAANALKQMTHDRDKISEKLAAMAKDLESRKQQLEELHGKHAMNISTMQKKIDSAEKLAADRKKDVDALASELHNAKRATTQADSLSNQLDAEKDALRKAVQEKDTLIEKMRQLRKERKEGEERLSQTLHQCRADSEEMEKRLKAEVRAAEKGSTEASQQMQDSAEQAIEAERAKYDKQLQALQTSLQNSHTDLQDRIEADEEFRKELQNSWQSEERKNHATVTQLNGRILEAEMQRDEAVADNERLREDLAKAHRPGTSIPSEESTAVEVTGSNDPCLQNRIPQSKGRSNFRDTTVASQDSSADKGFVHASKTNAQLNATHDSDKRSNAASTRGPIVEESQMGQIQAFDFSHSWSEPPSQEVIPESQIVQGPIVEESQQFSPAFSHSHTESYRSKEPRPSKQVRGPVVEETQQYSYNAFSQMQSQSRPRRAPFSEQSQQLSSASSEYYTSPAKAEKSTDRAGKDDMDPHQQDAYRGPIVEESQEIDVPCSQYTKQNLQSQHQASSMTRNFNKHSSRYQEAEAETQFVPETQYEEVQAPSFANFNASSTMRKGNENEIFSGAFDNIPTRAGALRLQNVPPRFQKPVPPPNTATKMVRLGTSSSSLSSLSERVSIPSSSAAAPEMVPSTAAEHKTPEPRSKGRKSRPASGAPSVSSPAFVEQKTKSHTQYTYHAGGSGSKNGGHHHSNHKESRAAAPKRKAQSQAIPGYEQEPKKKQVNRSSQGDANSLSELVESQNRGMRAPSSMRTTPRASTQPSRMQTFASAAASSTRQTRNSTRRLSKNDEINARFAHELSGAR